MKTSYYALTYIAVTDIVREYQELFYSISFKFIRADERPKVADAQKNGKILVLKMALYHMPSEKAPNKPRDYIPSIAEWVTDECSFSEWGHNYGHDGSFYPEYFIAPQVSTRYLNDMLEKYEHEKVWGAE